MAKQTRRQGSAQPSGPFGMDLGKLFVDYRIPGIDVEAMVASQRKNMEALTQANRLAYEGMQAVMQRQMEILRQTVEEVADAGKTLAGAETPQDRAARQTELAKEAFEKALANMRELSEMMARSNTEAADLLNKRFTQILDEVRESMVRSK